MSSPSRPGRHRLSTRLLLYFAIAYTVLIGLLGFTIMRSVRTVLVADLTHHLETDAQLVAFSKPDDPADLEAWARQMFETGGFRVTVIDTDGVVIADSHSDPDILENHGSREEVVEAMGGEVGHAVRVSVSTGYEQHYVALPPEDGVIVRLSLSVRSIEAQFVPIRSTVITTSIIAGIVGILVAAWLAWRLTRPITEITDQATAIAAGTSDTRPRRSSVKELDALGLAISRLADGLVGRAEEAERASELLQVVLGALPQGTVLIEGDDRFAYANPAAYSLLGSIPDGLGGLAPFAFQTAVREARETRSPATRTIELGKPARRIRGVAIPFTGEERILLILADVTDRERMDTVRRDFVANASHELKTPVSSIIASSEALRIAVNRGDDSATRFAGQIESSARQLDRLVNDLLDLSRLERESPDLDPMRLDLLVREEVERVRKRAGEAGIELTVDATSVMVLGSHRDLAIAIRNILDNAIRHTQSGGTVIAEVGIAAGEAVVSLADTGEGIPSRDLDRIFERFYRVDTARSRQSGGTGLGLAIVKHVVHAHGGAVEVQSELGVGSTFTLRFPVADEEQVRTDN